MTRRLYEVWASEAGYALAPADHMLRRFAAGDLGPGAHSLFNFDADTWEEACAILHLRMGWEPYKPPGAAAPCPNGCGGKVYPEGSGECPNCS